MTIGFESSGDFKKTEKFLNSLRKVDVRKVLSRYGQEGVRALTAATPVDSRGTANSWGFEVITKGKNYELVWTNNSMAGSTPVVILLQYGHGTGTGGYVPGRDFINPALRPIFDRIADEAWKAVTSA